VDGLKLSLVRLLLEVVFIGDVPIGGPEWIVQRSDSTLYALVGQGHFNLLLLSHVRDIILHSCVPLYHVVLSRLLVHRLI